MILDNEEADSRLNNPDNLFLKIRKNKEADLENSQNKPNVEILPMPHGGRKEGDRAIPPKVRELLAVLATEGNEDQADIASVFGVSQPTVSGASRGLVGDRLEEDLAETLDISKGKKEDTAHNLALDALVSSLTAVSEGLVVEKPSLKVAAKIATDMSRVVANLKPKDAPNSTSNVKVVLYAPQMRQENYYESAEV